MSLVPAACPPTTMPAVRYPTVVLSAVLLVLGTPRFTWADEPVDFGRDVRPILSNACFKCHGPGTQKGKLRLDDRGVAVEKGAIVPGRPEASELLRRVNLPDDDPQRMPPPGAGDRLTPEQAARLTAWVRQGAEYRPHWAFIRPTRPPVPGSGHPIDAFIRQRLARAGLSPSPEADKSTLLRRVTLDLTGLLPTPQEVQDFLADTSPNAYEKVVDRLLASPHYGERQARHWLDLARYADSNGYTIDSPRSIWPYRDWVIRAFNADLPFDQFTVEQLAGDLLPGATIDQKVATGFHRNTPFNEEGGTDPEQFRVERTVDRTNTTGAVWLGLTVACAQCHDHKYDPISQKDYYRLYAFFNSCDEPTLPLGGPPGLEARIAGLHEELAAARRVGNDAEAKRLLQEIQRAEGQIPTTLVLRERPTPRPTHVLIRGEFLRLGEAVTPGFPAVLAPAVPSPSPPSQLARHALGAVLPVAALAASPAPGQLTRLDLARWLVSPDNPLTARVTVNREWQKFFGRGLVETENDFGYQGELPTHPELLDWLACEFTAPTVTPGAKPWSLKALHRLIVTSATYKQASVVRPDLAEKDPRNRLLGRQNRLRLEAEIIRDAALGASGKLNPTIGGPGVFPPQPPDVFLFTQSQRKWVESQGPDRYRRGLYTFVWRQSQHPLLTTFDGPDAQTACTRRNRSNTPLQALHLANDPVFVELARHFGERIERDGPADDAGRLTFAFRVALARDPTPAERDRLLAYLTARRRDDPATTWAAVARVLLNLDEFITRE